MATHLQNKSKHNQNKSAKLYKKEEHKQHYKHMQKQTTTNLKKTLKLTMQQSAKQLCKHIQNKTDKIYKRKDKTHPKTYKHICKNKATQICNTPLQNYKKIKNMLNYIKIYKSRHT